MNKDIVMDEDNYNEKLDKILNFLEIVVDKLSDMDDDIEKKYQNLKYQISAK